MRVSKKGRKNLEHLQHFGTKLNLRWNPILNHICSKSPVVVQLRRMSRQAADFIVANKTRAQANDDARYFFNVNYMLYLMLNFGYRAMNFFF